MSEIVVSDADQVCSVTQVEVENSAPAAARQVPEIPYAIAKASGIVVVGDDTDQLEVALREGSDPKVLIEARRFL